MSPVGIEERVRVGGRGDDDRAVGARSVSTERMMALSTTRTVCPIRSGRRARARHRHADVPSGAGVGSGSRNSSSTFPPVSFLPSTRAGITRVSFAISTALAGSSSTISENR